MPKIYGRGHAVHEGATYIFSPAELGLNGVAVPIDPVTIESNVIDLSPFRILIFASIATTPGRLWGKFYGEDDATVISDQTRANDPLFGYQAGVQYLDLQVSGNYFNCAAKARLVLTSVAVAGVSTCRLIGKTHY